MDPLWICFQKGQLFNELIFDGIHRVERSIREIFFPEFIP